jgi:hypothetical protein
MNSHTTWACPGRSGSPSRNTARHCPAKLTDQASVPLSLWQSQGRAHARRVEATAGEILDQRVDGDDERCPDRRRQTIELAHELRQLFMRRHALLRAGRAAQMSEEFLAREHPAIGLSHPFVLGVVPDLHHGALSRRHSGISQLLGGQPSSVLVGGDHLLAHSANRSPPFCQ